YFLSFSFLPRPPPTPTLFPYTRSSDLRAAATRKSLWLLQRGCVGDGERIPRSPPEFNISHHSDNHPWLRFFHFVRFISEEAQPRDRKSTRLNSSHVAISYAVFCLKKKK